MCVNRELTIPGNISKISVLLVEDHVVVREGLRCLLQKTGEFDVIGEAGTGRQAIEMAMELRPDVIVMDIAMPLLNGVEATRIITQELPEAKVLMLSSYDEDRFVRQVVEAGAVGYLVKHAEAGDLLTAIREVSRGNEFFSPSIARKIHGFVGESFLRRGASGKDAALTSRETQVLQLIAEGHLNKQIADILEISIKTVEKHRQQVMDKLKIRDTAGLTRYAIAKGIVEAHRRGESR